MRREEVCGLMIADVVLDADVPHFDLRQNKYRALKNSQSKRRVPVHPELLRLGLADYIRAVGALGYDLLFPDLLPATEGTALLGDQLHDDWSKVLKAAISDAGSTNKTFHSFRHSGNDALADAEVMLEWRQDTPTLQRHLRSRRRKPEPQTRCAIWRPRRSFATYLGTTTGQKCAETDRLLGYFPLHETCLSRRAEC